MDKIEHLNKFCQLKIDDMIAVHRVVFENCKIYILPMKDEQ